MSEFRGLYDVRDMIDADKNFIMATFLRGVYYGDMWYSLIPKNIFMDNYKKIAEDVVDGRKAVIKVACLKEDPSVILGYSILSTDYQAVIWTFVKTPWRKRGIARSLVPQYPVACTHLSKLGQSLMSKFPGIVFNPFYPIN